MAATESVLFFGVIALIISFFPMTTKQGAILLRMVGVGLILAGVFGRIMIGD